MKNIEIIVKENEEKIIPYVWMNGDEKEISFTARLVGDGANFHLVGIFVGTDASSVVFNTHVTHEAKNTKSRTELRGVFKDRSTFSNDAMVHIQKGAKQADGYFTSKVLLFDDAKGRSVPSLEIDDNEIKAGHASTVGRPDENQVFYLRSRGLSEKDAERLLVTGFFEPIVEFLPSADQNSVRKNIKSFF